MKATLNILLMIFLGLSLSFCSSSSKDTDDSQAAETEVDGYNSSSTYDDIAGAAGDAELDVDGGSSDYSSEDSYGSADEEPASGGSDDLFLGGTEDSSAGSEAGEEPLPVEAIEEYKDAPSAAVPTGFKDGFYNMSRNCNMRQEPTTSSAKAGKVQAGKRLWVEGYNDKWVKVFKKSGPVYLSKICL